MTQMYASWRAAPSFADLVLMTHRHLVCTKRKSQQDRGHAAVVQAIKSEEEVIFTVSDGSWDAVGIAKVVLVMSTNSAKH